MAAVECVARHAISVENSSTDAADTGQAVPPVLQKLQKWADYPSFGARMQVGFIPGKTPLSQEILASWSFDDPPKHPHTVASFLQATRERGDTIGAFLDLSAHECLYAQDIPDGTAYFHVQLVAKVYPSPEAIQRVAHTAQEFWREHPDQQIAIHCAYGFNRTGFVVCSYLVLYAGFTVDGALAAFAEARPPGVKHEDFVEELHRRYGPKPMGILSACLGGSVPPTVRLPFSAGPSTNRALGAPSAGPLQGPGTAYTAVSGSPAAEDAAETAQERAQSSPACTATRASAAMPALGGGSGAVLTDATAIRTTVSSSESSGQDMSEGVSPSVSRTATEPICIIAKLRSATIHEAPHEGTDSMTGAHVGDSENDMLVNPIADLLARSGSQSGRNLSRQASLGLARALTGDFVSSSPPHTLGRISPSLQRNNAGGLGAPHGAPQGPLGTANSSKTRSTSLVSNESFMSGLGMDFGHEGVVGALGAPAGVVAEGTTREVEVTETDTKGSRKHVVQQGTRTRLSWWPGKK